MQEREVVNIHVLVVVTFHGLEGIDEGRVRVREITEVGTDVARDNGHVVLCLEALAEGYVVIKNGTDGAETEEEFAMIAREVERFGFHHNFKLVVSAAKVAGKVVVLGDNLELGLHLVLPDTELAAHILEGAFQFAIGEVAACLGAEHRNLEGFHVRAACRGVFVFFLVAIGNLLHVPRVGLFTQGEEERVGGIARAENGNLEQFEVGIQVRNNLLERSVLVQEYEELHEALRVLEAVETAVFVQVQVPESLYSVVGIVRVQA